MKVKELFKKQKAFQKLLKYNIDAISKNPDLRNSEYKEHCLNTVEEIIEGLRNIHRKPWKQTKEDDNLDELKDELIDEFRFFLNRCILMGMTSEEFVERFNKSIKKTEDRIKNKY